MTVTARAIGTLIVFVASIIFVIYPVSFHVPFKRFKGRQIRINLTTAPIAAIAILWAAQCLGPREIRLGIVGTDGVKPYNILILFFSLAYMAITLDITGVLRAAAFWVSNKGGSNGWKLYIYFYVMLTVLSVVLGNDPVILSGTVFLVYYTEAQGLDPVPWLMAEFAAANTASMVLFVGNPTNVVICEGFRVNNAGFTGYTILPFVACSVICLGALVLQFRKQIPRHLKNSELNVRAVLLDPIGAWVGSILLGTCLVVIIVVSFIHVDVWKISLPFAVAKFLYDLVWDQYRYWHDIPILGRKRADSKDGVDDDDDDIENKIMANQFHRNADRNDRKSVDGSRITEEPTPFVNENDPSIRPVSMSEPIALKLQVPMYPSSSAGTTRSNTEDSVFENMLLGYPIMKDKDSKLPPIPASPSEGMKSLPTGILPPDILNSRNEMKPVPKNTHVSSGTEVTKSSVDTKAESFSTFRERYRKFRHLFATHFPTLYTALPRLPFALVPFAFSQFILIEALARQGWIDIFARWLVIASGRQVFPTVWLVGILGVILCNISGTNIGATILLTKIVRASSMPDHTARAAAIALAIASNIGAVSFTFSASLAGLLWNQILEQKGIHIKQRVFACWNLLPLSVMTAVGLGVVCAEMAVLYRGAL